MGTIFIAGAYQCHFDAFKTVQEDERQTSQMLEALLTSQPTENT